jgi:predicted RNA binding protein YcfA (HicA-like mRNA interferase family)
MICSGGAGLSKWEKLIDEILKSNKNLRFDDLAKALSKIGYVQRQPSGGSSHYTFRKNGEAIITLPKSMPMNKAYIELVKEAVIKYESEDGRNE